MCRIEQFHVVYPDETRERREQVVPCRYGTRSQPCRHPEVANLGDRLASASDLRRPLQPHIVPIEPRDLESSRLRPRSMETSRGPIGGLALNIKFWNPFSSKNKEKKGKMQYYVVRKTKKSERGPAVIQQQPPIPPPPRTQFVPLVRGEHPVVIPMEPPERPPTHHPLGRERRRRSPIPAVIHQSSEEDEDESLSPLEANREHGRRTRSLSPNHRYHVEKERIRQRELRQREYQERIKREEREARERASILEHVHRQRAMEERQEQIRQQRREDRQRQRLANEWEARRQQQLEEQARVVREQEDLERLREVARARILQEQEDLERLREAERARQLREERAWRHQEEWRLRDEQARRQYEERQRYARAHQANIPRRPRHPVFVHPNEDRLDRGDRFIQNAIRAENLRQFERRAGWARGRYDDGALRRRNTIDGGQRWYDGQWRRERR